MIFAQTYILLKHTRKIINKKILFTHEVQISLKGFKTTNIYVRYKPQKCPFLSNYFVEHAYYQRWNFAIFVCTLQFSFSLPPTFKNARVALIGFPYVMELAADT